MVTVDGWNGWSSRELNDKQGKKVELGPGVRMPRKNLLPLKIYFTEEKERVRPTGRFSTLSEMTPMIDRPVGVPPLHTRKLG